MLFKTDTEQDFLLSIPWCRKLLKDPTNTVGPFPSRLFKESGEDAFFAETLNSRHTVRACVAFWKTPQAPDSPPSEVSSTSENADAAPILRVNEVNVLFAIGPGINGYPHIAHGGFVASILDEVTGILLSLNKRLGPTSGQVDDGHMTAYLNVRYIKPVTTPSVVLVEARFKKIEGRKRWIEGVVKDHHGTDLASCEALFVRLKPKL